MADRQLDPNSPYASPDIEQVSQEAGDVEGATGQNLQDLDQVPEFRQWKSVMDKKLAEKEAELARLRGQAQTDDPTRLTSQRNSLLTKYQQAEQAAAAAKDDGDEDNMLAAAAQAARLADKIFETDVRLAAHKRGLNANDPDLRQMLDEAYENGEISGPQDIDYLMLTFNERKPQGKQAVTPDKLPDLSEWLEDTKKKLELELRAKMGLGVPGVSPGAPPGNRAKILRDMEVAKQAGDGQTYLGLKRQLLNLEE